MRPRASTKYPPMTLPVRALRGISAPTHDFWSSVNVSVELGEAIDARAGDVYAELNPTPIDPIDTETAASTF